MGKFDGPPPGVDENREKELRRLARMLATQRMNNQTSLRYAQFALRDIPEAFDWLVTLFEHLTKNQGLTLRWLSPHRVRGSLNPWTIAFAIGPADGDPENNTAFFRLDDGRLEAAELIADEAELSPRLAIVLGWDAQEKLAEVQAAWHEAILLQLAQDLHTRASSHPVKYLRLMVTEIAGKKTVQLPDIILGYLALGLNPGACIAETLAKHPLELPIPFLEDIQP